jgi:hypothetical protein
MFSMWPLELTWNERVHQTQDERVANTLLETFGQTSCKRPDTVMTLVFKHLWISRRLLHYSKVDLLSGKDSFQVLVTQA